MSAALFGLLVIMRRAPGERLRQWIDRKFFHETYAAELLLSELADTARSITDPAALIDTVARRISEVLHVPQIAVLLRNQGMFRLEYALGFALDNPILMSENSLPVRHLVRTNSPAVLYRDKPVALFFTAPENEHRALKDMNPEVLLPLPGTKSFDGVDGAGIEASRRAVHALGFTATASDWNTDGAGS